MHYSLVTDDVYFQTCLGARARAGGGGSLVRLTGEQVRGYVETLIAEKYIYRLIDGADYY